MCTSHCLDSGCEISEKTKVLAKSSASTLEGVLVVQKWARMYVQHEVCTNLIYCMLHNCQDFTHDSNSDIIHTDMAVTST